MGEKYTLVDNYEGGLEGAGSGTIDVGSSSVAVTLESLPDEGSFIIFHASKIVAEETHQDSVTQAHYDFNIGEDGRYIKNDSISGSYIANGTTYTFSDADTANATYEVYSWGIRVFPTKLPDYNSDITLDYEYHNTASASFAKSDPTTDEYQFTVNEGNIEPNTFRGVFRWNAFSDSHAISLWFFWYPYAQSRSIIIEDDGNGQLVGKVGSDTVAFGTVTYNTGEVTIHPRVKYKKREKDGQCSYHWVSVERDITSSESVSLNIEYSPNPTTPPAVSIARNIQTLGIQPTTEEIHASVCENGISFKLADRYYVTDGYDILLANNLPNSHTIIGSVNKTTSLCSISSWTNGANNNISNSFCNWIGATDQPSRQLTFYAERAPIQSGSVTGSVYLEDGAKVDFTSDTQGDITSNGSVTGKIYGDTGVIMLEVPTTDNNWMLASTMRYSVVVHDIVPVHSDIIKMDVVRLPVDGRVPIYRRGDMVVLLNEQEITGNYNNGDVVNLRPEVTCVHVFDATGAQVDATAFTFDQANHTLTWDNVNGITMPAKILDRVENMRVVSKVTNTGHIEVTRQWDYAFPTGSLLCSALVHTDVFASVSTPFDQHAWTGAWSDNRIGNDTLGSYNPTIYPIQVYNRSTVTERWLIKFRSSSTVDVIGEHLGVVLVGASVGSDISPVNPIKSMPYFTIPAGALASGFVNGNVVRFNTVGAVEPIWVVKALSVGNPTDTSIDANRFCVEFRGAVNA